MNLPNKDFREFIELLLSRRVEFLLVGGYAVAAQGAPRFTEDIDFLIKSSPGNARKMEEVIAAFGFQELGIQSSDFLEPAQVIQLGRAPHRIDLLTSITGVTWEEAWSSRKPIILEGYNLWVLGREALIKNKRAAARPQDLADVARLERGRKA